MRGGAEVPAGGAEVVFAVLEEGEDGGDGAGSGGGGERGAVESGESGGPVLDVLGLEVPDEVADVAQPVLAPSGGGLPPGEVEAVAV